MGREERRRRAREAARQALLDAATRILTEEGLSALSIRRVAAEAGYGTGTVYLHFKDKADLLHQWMLSGFGEFLARVEAIPAEVRADPVAWIVALMGAYVDFGLANGDALRLAFSPEMRAAEPPMPLDHPGFADAPGNAYLAAALRELAAQGQFAEADVPVAVASLWTATHGLVLALAEQPALPAAYRDRLIHFHLDVLVRGVLATGGQP